MTQQKFKPGDRVKYVGGAKSGFQASDIGRTGVVKTVESAKDMRVVFDGESRYASLRTQENFELIEPTPLGIPNMLPLATLKTIQVERVVTEEVRTVVLELTEDQAKVLKALSGFDWALSQVVANSPAVSVSALSIGFAKKGLTREAVQDTLFKLHRALPD